MDINSKKLWLSDGPEQIKLEKLIKSGKIQNDQKPADIQRKFKEHFGMFSPSVFRTHLSLTRRNLGEYI